MSLGLESGEIPDDQITASSFGNSGYKCCHPSFARLRKDKRWRARQDDTDKWIQIDLKNTYTVTGIVVQGYTSWVKTCKVKYEEVAGSGVLVYIVDKERKIQVSILTQALCY